MKRQRRRLSDLYVRGMEVEVDDGSGDPVIVWMQKLNPVDRDTAMRRAHAAQARYLTDMDDEESERFQSMYAQIRDTGESRDILVDFLIAEELAKYRERVASERGNDEETWGKDEYLTGLIEAWVGDDDNPGLAAAKAEDPKDPEALRVLAEIERFEAEVAQIVDAEGERLRKDWVDVPIEVIWRRSAEQMLKNRALEAFGREFERQQLFFSVREPEDHSKRYFGSLVELDDLDEQVHNVLMRAYGKLNMDALQGKSSGASPDSSNKSESSPEEETSPASGPPVATE